MAASPTRWRRCDPGDGSDAYFFHLDSGETAWDPPPGVDVSTVREFGFDDEHVLDDLGIAESQAESGQADQVGASAGNDEPVKTAGTAADGPKASATAIELPTTSVAPPHAHSAASAGSDNGKPEEPAPRLTETGIGATAAVLGEDGASDSTDCPTPPPLPPVADMSSEPGSVAPPPVLSGGVPSPTSAFSSSSIAAPTASHPSAVPDDPELPDIPFSAEESPSAVALVAAEPSLPASLFAWGLCVDNEAVAQVGGGPSLSGTAMGCASVRLGVWGRGGGTSSSIVGTLGHAASGGRVSFAGQWETRRGETRGNAKGETYWYNRETGETLWEKPDGAVVGADRESLVTASLNQSDVSPTDPLLGLRPTLDTVSGPALSPAAGGSAASRAALNDPDLMVEAVWGGSHRGHDEASDASSLLLLVGLLPQGLAESWTEIEAEAREATSSPHATVDREAAEEGQQIPTGALSAAAELQSREAASRGLPTPWLTLPTVPLQFPAAGSPMHAVDQPPSSSLSSSSLGVGDGDGGSSELTWSLRSPLPSAWQTHLKAVADHKHDDNEHGADDDDDDDDDEGLGGATHDEEDVLVEVMRCAQGLESATSLYRRLLALLQLMQRYGDDSEWAELLAANGYILPRLLLSCLTPSAPPAVCRAASQCLFLAAQLDDTVARLIVTPMGDHSPITGPSASVYPPWKAAAATSSGTGMWRHWNGLQDAVGVCCSGMVAALHGWRLRWPRSPAAIFQEETGAVSGAKANASAGAGADAVCGVDGGVACWDGEALRLVSATASLIDEESLFSFSLLLELALGACFSDPVSKDLLLLSGSGSVESGVTSGEVAALACLSCPETRIGLCWLCGAVAVCAPRGRTSGAAVGALSAMVMACEEAGAEGSGPEEQSTGAADLGADEEYGVGEGPIAGLTGALQRDPSLVPLLSTTLLEVLVRVEHRDGRGAVASASQEQVMASTGLIKRLLQPGALPQPALTPTPASASDEAAGGRGEARRDAILFFTSDLRVLVDICVREVVDLPDADPLRAEFLQLLRDVLLFSQWAGEGMYRADDIVSIVSDLVTTGAADAEPAVRDAAEALLVDCRDLLDD